MRIPDEIRECVCFIEARRAGGPIFLGSAFFVGVALGFDDQIAVYVVTAKHCIVDDTGPYDEIVLRLNTRAGGSGRISTNPADWLLHPSADAAILPFAPDRMTYQYRVYAAISAATREFVKARNVGPGDEVFITGLLVHHPGKTRIMPVVRLGSIAALPEDPVMLATGEDVVALLEVRSIGGLSGSPVFVHLPFWRDTEKGDIFVGQGGKASRGGESWLLGVMHGFYPVGKNDPDGVSGGNENLNTGIAVVVLVDRMMDLIDHPDQVRMRDNLKKQLEKSRMPMPTVESSLSVP